MTDRIYQSFPNHIEKIQALLQKDATFSEICADYEEICTWLTNHCHTKGLPSEECDHARELMRNLEEDIREALGDTGI